nr:MAG TPA: hypothetical protein [Caudoviricetes sp.]
MYGITPPHFISLGYVHYITEIFICTYSMLFCINKAITRLFIVIHA